MGCGNENCTVEEVWKEREHCLNCKNFPGCSAAGWKQEIKSPPICMYVANVSKTSKKLADRKQK
jgi:hypothetical protein